MIYGGLTAALATRHGKERVIAPAFAAATGLCVTVPPGIDTDALGTFTGEVTRPASMRDTARLKARRGMAAAGLPFGIASEGSFGPHPVVPFVAAGRELMIFIDDMHGIEVVEEAVSEHTNFAALDLVPGTDVDRFLARVGFPQHAVVLRWRERVIKGIDTHDQLASLLSLCTGPAQLETDMRAHMNPTRMAEIGKLAVTLARRMATLCPACTAPGFGPVRREAGLPCADCETPTPLVKTIVSGCAVCGHEAWVPRSDGRTTASPAECPACNP